MSQTISCGKCKGEWTGAGRCHCGGCHLTFSSLGAFDLHQKRKYAPEGQLCGNPALTLLVPVDKEYGVLWSYPSRDDETSVEDCCEEVHYRDPR